MMTYLDFYEIAKYFNDLNNGCYSPEEVKENADIYFSDYKASIEYGKPTFVMEELHKLLEEDDTEESLEWLKRIKKDIQK